ncbi:non-ribosomal peptide synthetase [Jatrophihabitans endophyticus]|uniref:non-ribosomal peptide synthetase n=1 Tax=Jatrophihabitans endophyticus TaxID=1206085 RepID=UPI001356324F|nr:amino acid adenylation domain-containing protein [Jatrophihabitans endophyticus]
MPPPFDLPSAVLAAHLRVAGELSGDDLVEVEAEGTDGDSSTTTVAVDLAGATWRDLHHQLGPVAGALRLADARRATTVTLDGDELTVHADSGDAAVRLVGYHEAALGLLVDDPDADASAGRLIDAAEEAWQQRTLHGASVPVDDLLVPDRIVANCARLGPSPALVDGARTWSYADVEAASGRVSAALAAGGVGRGDVVAVVSERHADWVLVLLGVLRSGAVYCPIDPRFPAERIRQMVVRSGARVVLTDTRGDDLAARLALADGHRVETMAALLAAAADADADAAAPPVDLRPDDAAYIFFTSGSTGQPKASLLGHDGMRNHVAAKIADLGMGADARLAQVAPQCFDISIWQVLAPLVTGGVVVVVPQDVVTDVSRFVDLLDRERITVVQVVPSYLDVVIDELTRRGRAPAALRAVSVTGEALLPDLVERWFATVPDVPLLNAYGLTETSDDTCHQLLGAPPADGVVPLGRPVQNVTAYVVDADLRLVPFGAPGELVFGGVCVGLGYCGDPERTAAAFVPDPFVPGGTLYRTGDFGRWRPDGALEFFGRRDSQIKINGHRIEIGEIEANLRVAADDSDCAVVVLGRGPAARLAAFVAAAPHRPLARYRAALADVVPPHLVPSEFHWVDRLPLTDNGKVDRVTLATAAAPVGANRTTPPRLVTPAERLLAQAWAAVLGCGPDDIDRDDAFTALGGTSVAALRVVARLDGRVRAEDFLRAPTLAELATRLTHTGDRPLVHAFGEAAAGDVIACPYAGGTAAAFAPMAAALHAHGIRVLGCDRPADDVPADDVPADGAGLGGTDGVLTRTAHRIVDEAAHLGVREPVVWGHSAGAALAIAVCDELARRAIPVRALVIGAFALPADARLDTRIEQWHEGGAELARADLEAELAALTEPGASGDIGDLLDERAVRRYRRDVLAALHYLRERRVGPAVRVPAVLAVGERDHPLGPDDRRGWLDLVPGIRHVRVPDADHYFVQTAPHAAAQIVLDLGATIGPRA